MSKDYVPIEPAGERTLSGRTVLVAAGVAFLVGLLVMGLAIRQFGSWQAGSTAHPLAAPSATPTDATTQGENAAPAAAPATDLVTLGAREAALAAQISDLEARQISLGAQASRAADYATRSEGMMVAFAARRALDRGLGLGYIEQQLRDRFGQAQPRAVAIVIQVSRQPVTLEDLREGLDTLTPDLVSGTARDGWLAGLRRELSGLVSLRHEGTPSPRPADRMERAKRLLDGGQVEAALAEVSRLPGAPQAENWIKAARRYIAARRALDVIETAALLGQGTAPPAATSAAGLPPTPVSAN